MTMDETKDLEEPKRRRRRRRPLIRSRLGSGTAVASWMQIAVALCVAVSLADCRKLAFTRQRYNATIYENNIGKSYATPETERMGIQLPEASTATDIRYRIISGDKNKLFKAESRQVGDFSFLLLRTRTGQVDVLNRERTELHKLRVRAMLRSAVDGSDSDLPDAEADVWVYVQDTNDLSPLFYPSEYEVNVPEDSPLHVSLVQVKADDADVGVNGEIYYSLADASETFAVHPLTGVISLTRPLVFADQPFHELIVLANDRGPKLGTAVVGAASRARVRVHVMRVNQHEPRIHVRHLPEVVEQSQVDVYAVVRVEDADQGPSGHIRSLDIIGGDPDGYFRVQRVGNVAQPADNNNGAEFNIAVLKLLDRERAPMGYNLTLRAVDGGTPARNSTATLHVTVSDWNDHAPVFDRQHYDVRVVETAPVGTPLIRLRVSDEDQGRNAQVQLSIVGGNQGGHFRINPTSGVLYTALPLDAEMRAEHVLTVSAIDQGTAGTRQQSSAKITVQVLDANDNDPIFYQQPGGVLEIQVDENEQAGAEVARATARDADAGENAYISYSLANLAPVPFEVDPFTGAIRTTETLDYETGRRRYMLKIRASDWGTPYRRQSELLVTVIVRDVNDNRPQFQRVGCVGRVPRTTAIGSELLTLSAVDFDQGNTVVYRIVSGNEDGCFSLDSSSGAVGVACDLSDLGISERFVNVTATDGQHFADIMTIRIHLTAGLRGEEEPRFECRETGLGKKVLEMMNAAAKRQTGADDSDPVTELPPLPSRYGQNVHTPEFYDFPVQVRVNESVSSGTALIRLRARDRDHGYNGLLVYVISGGDDDSAFQIETETGLLRVAGQLDREKRAGYSLNVTVLDLGQPQKSAWRILPVIVTDVNDNPPRFDRPVISVSIAETAQMGTSVAQLSASDADEGDNAKITFSLAAGASPDMKLDPNTGLLTVAGQLDRERQDFYEMAVIARDGSPNGPGLTAKALVRVRILDVNDVAPRFARPWQVVKIREDMPVGAVVALVEANDPDLGAGGSVRYSLASSYASETVERFAIDRVTGTVRLSRRLDFEDRSVYNLTVRAKDRGSPSLSSEAYLAIEVVDVNENLYAPRFEDFVTEASVRENAPPGTLVAKVTATDADPSGDDSRLSYAIRGGTGLGLFSIDNEGGIRTRAVLDRETTPHYWLTVVAQDHGIVTLSASIEVFVEVLDENDHIPLTTEPVYWVHVAENSPPRTPVARITAIDGDRNSKLTYQLKAGNPQSLFDIDPNTGNITTTGRRLDRENLTEHILEVLVIDNGNPTLSSSTRVVVTVDDVNDNAPEFLERFYKIQIPASVISHPESVVLQVEAFDRDTGENGRVEYSLMETASTKGRFRIHPHSGIIYSQKSLSAGQEFSFSVRASDRGRPSRNATTRVSVAVIGVPPQSASPPELSTDNSRRADVMESDPVGHAVAFITANDPDGDMLWYKIEDGNIGDKFAMQTTGNGKVYVAQPLDWEQQSSYLLNISITDGHNTIYTQLEITVLDVNDHPPVFSEQHYRAEVSENAEVGAEIITLNATDADQDKRVFYALHAASSASSLRKFKVDSIRGVVTLAEKLDRETMAQHLLTVSVKDQGTPSKRNFARLLIDVSDHNDHTPEFMSELVQVRIFETAAVGSVVTMMLAIDKDRGANSKVTYSISSGNVGGAFVIEPDSGLIRVNQPLDVGTAHEYMLVVKASDGGSPSLSTSCRVHILVTMAENDPPKFLQSEYTADVFEDATGGTFVIQVEGRSISSLLFEITDGNSDGSFTINPSTGIIVVSPRGALDYETTKHYNLSISAMNMAGSSARCLVHVHVSDVNDNSPTFSQELYEGTIAESALAGSLVFQRLSSAPLVVSAKDGDSGVNALLSYDIVEPRAAQLFAIDSNTGAVRTLAPLDREQLARVEFTVQVSDHGRPRRSSDQVARVSIVITDVNDSPPKFVGQLPYSVSLLLPTFPGVAVVRVRAEDPDVDVNSTLTYRIKGGNGAGKFAIDRRTGWISVSDTDGLAGNNFYTLEVSVSDGKFSTATKVDIQLEKMMASGLAFAQDKYTGYVTENSTRGATTIVALNVLGTHLNEHVTFSILNPQGLFQVGSTSGVVQAIGQVPFDREVEPRYVIVVEARSERGDGEKPRIAHTRVEIEVTDINDNRPAFFNLPYYAVVSAEAPKGSVVTKVQAMDKDVGENGDIRYELLRGSGELFRVDRRTGEILLRHVLEGQQGHSDYELVVAAYDGGTPPLSSEALVRVKVVTKSQPVFGQQYYSASVLESADPLSPVLSVQASSPSGRQLIYSIVSGNEGEEFAVDFNTAHNSENGPCLIYIVNRLDYEARSKYELLVRATDSVSGSHSEVPVSVSVDDANDSPPEFSNNEYNVTLSEATPSGTVVLAVSAHDLDSGTNAEVVYRLLPDTNGGQDTVSVAAASAEFFHINPEDGTLILARSLDRETQSLHHLLVMASDQGNPSLSSTAHIWIRVEDVNDNPPQFEQRSYRCVLSEDGKRGQFVTMVTATDPDVSDQTRLVYSLTGGNDQQMFNIDSKRGTVTLGNLHRFGEQPNYLLNISVSDGVFTSFAALQVDLLSTNRHLPSFSRPLYEVEVLENLPAGTLVIQLNATDLDRDDFGRITYAILSTVASEMFRIDEETGDVFTRRPLDREVRKVHEIPVVAFDAGGKSGHATLRVKVGDVNDNRPRFLLAEYRANIHANYSVGQPFLKVQAMDLDVDNNAKLSYSIYESNGTKASDTFDINSSTGELFLKQNALALANEVFQFFVRAEDHGSPVLGTEAPVDVLILDPQERAPTFERTSSKYFISESAPVGTTIARVKAVSGGEQLHYTIVPAPRNPDSDDGSRDEDVEPSPFFSVDDQGQIYLSLPLDRETCDIHIITVVASTDTSPPIIAFTEVIIQVLDTNEHPPEFESNPYQIVVAENAEKGTSVIRVSALDGDRVTGTYGDLRYSFGHSMAPELANIFRLDSVTGWITTLGLLDREERDRYILPIIASDNGTPAKLTSTTAVVIEVRDYNDNPPQFAESHYVAAVNEEALPGTVVVRLTTTDRDRDESRSDAASSMSQQPQLHYYIISGDPRAQFGIRQGEVYVERALDREEIGSYSLQVLATDGFFTATTHVTVDILDDNDHAPVCTQHRYHELVSEATSPGTFIVRVRATDADEGPNAKMKFYLTGEAADFFFLDPSSGQLKTLKALDRETRPTYALTAHVQDRERPQWECTSEVVIVLMDVNDNAPSFNQDWYTFAVPEDAELRTIVGKIHATDSDLGLNRKIRYSMVTSTTSLAGQNSFAIDAESGIVTVAKGLDRETVSSYNLTVSAIDLGTPALVSTVVVTVVVTDVNDNPPQFSRKLYAASVAESGSIGTEILNVLATSLDIGVNAEIKYSIVGGNEHRHFAMDPISGVISLAEPLDYERAREFYLTIQALDGGVPPLSNHAAVNITVLDSNDNPPIFTQSSYSAAIREDAIIGETVLRLNAVDLDSGDNGRITYTLLNGDRHSQFRIDGSTGLLTVAGQLDRELITSYMLEVEARDNGAPSSLAGNVLVSVEITDANDNPPAFSQVNYTAIAQEDKPLGFVILKLQVTDADGPTNAGPFTFEIRSGNVDNAFRIDGNGSLRTARRFNHKVRDHYVLQIVVFDNGNPPLYTDTWVLVKVIEESKYPPIITPLEININSFLDEYAGGVIGRVHVNDQDPYDTLVYSLVEEKGYHQYSSVALFELDSEDGTLIAKPGLDVGAYTVNVSVTDGKFFTYSSVKVNVVFISDEALQNAIILTVRDITADDFVTSYRKNFLKAVRNIMNVRTKDVFIISIQPQVTTTTQPSSKSNRTRRGDDTSPLRKSAAVTRLEPMWRIRDPARQSRPNVDILFSVQKPAGGFYPPSIVRKQLLDNVAELEATIDHHRISGTIQGFCTANLCGNNGKCYDRVVLDDTMTVAITSDISSFVAPRHKYKPTCVCKDGYGGEKCDVVANECALNPCPDSRVCRPESGLPGYSCRCPENHPGCVNELTQMTPCKDSTSGCYQPSHPIFFSGKSYAQYSLGSSIERRLLLTLRFRTVHQTGSIMFASGRIDYSILEIVNGEVQYRFDCGSGEGLVRVTGLNVNDGAWHDIRVERHGSVAEVTVDGSYRSQGAAPGVNDVLNLEPISDHVFFGAEVRTMDDVRMGFVGCLDEIRLNDNLLPQHIPISSPASSLNSLGSSHSTSASPSITLKRFTNVEFVCRVPLERPGVCGSQPCLNGGTCTEMAAILPGYQCACRPRFMGARCEIDSDPCASSPCLFNGRCYNLNNDFRCECPARLSGKRCEYGRYCNPNPCKNGGICEEGSTGPICKCRGFTGDTCSVDVNECEPSPCQNGGTCVNIVGSFQCLCPLNATGHYCTELAFKNDSITSDSFFNNFPLLWIIVVAVGLTVIILLIILLVSCWWKRNKRSRSGSHRSHSMNDPNVKEMVPLNSTRPMDLSEFKRGSKMSNLEATNQVPPMLPPRPASYTPSIGEPTYLPLNNLDTIRSYGSAADELETYPMLGMPTYNGNGMGSIGGHNNPDYHPNLNRPSGVGMASNGGTVLASPPLLLPAHDALSDSDSVHKPRWSDLESNLKGSYYEAAKIHNDLKGKCSETGSTANRIHHNHHHLNGNHYGHTGGLMLSNVKSTNKDTTTMSSSVSPSVSANVDDCARGQRGGLALGTSSPVTLLPPTATGVSYNSSISPLPTPPPSPPAIPPLPKDYAEFELSLQTLMRQTALLNRPSPSYHWDCSDWANQSQNPLPNITEVPGSEIPDSSSFHSNESNESNGNNHQLDTHGMMMTISPERDLDTLVEDPKPLPTSNGFRSLDSDCGTDVEMGSNNTNPFRSCQPPSFEEILANSGLRLSDLAVVSLPNSDGGCSDSEAPSESLPPPGNYSRHPNHYLPPYSIASETEAEDSSPVRSNGNGRQQLNGRNGYGNRGATNNDHDDDDDSSPSSSSSFASQIHRPLTNLRAVGNGASAASSAHDRVSSLMGSCSDVSNLCDIEDSEFEVDDVRPRMPAPMTTIHKPGQPIQTDV
ncbi:fat-like cadherin-related tumor suppressor homolog isoform X3 [Daphnia magna]|uniref:fat-like cadherin-related tumor suppressor homolog isoform X3 n=1 Tax=Daphnia magna TaxID=35525 RepID=UPI001E1BB85F|nr:fat-like cadherin-related tumor suppressor homolog isoform X3 [Daphnia magna]